MLTPFNYRSVHEFFITNHIFHKDSAKWRLTKQSLVEVNGLPNLRGFLIATNGILAYLENEVGKVSQVHFEWLVAAKNEELCFADGSLIHKPQRDPVEIDINDLLALVK